MRRAQPEHRRRVVLRRLWPLVRWYTCAVCDMEFRRERGWLHKYMDTPDSFAVDAVCAECCPTEQAAYRALVAKGLLS